MGLFNRNKNKGAPAAARGGTVTLDGDTTYDVTVVVDCLGDSCPRPQLMTRKAMASAAPGSVVEVQVDNPTSMEALAPMMPELGGTHLGTLKSERSWRVILRKN